MIKRAWVLEVGALRSVTTKVAEVITSVSMFQVHWGGGCSGQAVSALVTALCTARNAIKGRSNARTTASTKAIPEGSALHPLTLKPSKLPLLPSLSDDVVAVD
ncbi:unnamed protein product [Citrullus colocynthis]|uniref:Uncharacterized protein n=1 Tax=Citrullus colocynthis TaxID=252529 RepID=A0ABP0XUT6_9ROSI